MSRTPRSTDSPTPPPGTVPQRYFEVYNLLFKFENWLRVFVYMALKASFGRDWILRPVGEDDSKSTIRSVSSARIAALRAHSYVGETSDMPMLYLGLDELIGLIQDPRNRRVFQPILRGAVETLGPKLQEVRVIRNNLAHFRKVTEDDVDRISRSLADINPAIDSYLEEATADIEIGLTDDAAGLDSLQALTRQLLDGVASFDIEIRRSRNWLRITIVHSLRQQFRHETIGTNWLWVMSPSQVWDSLKNSDVDGSVVFYVAYGSIGREEEGVVEGNVGVDFALPWRSRAWDVPSPDVETFIRALASLAKVLDQEYAHSEAVRPRLLVRRDAQRLAQKSGGPFDNPYFVRDPNITEDWTGTWSTCLLPWVDEQMGNIQHY